MKVEEVILRVQELKDTLAQEYVDCVSDAEEYNYGVLSLDRLIRELKKEQDG